MSNTLIALMFAAGIGTWVGNKVYQRTGYDTQRTVIVGGLAGAFAFLVMLTVLWMI